MDYPTTEEIRAAAAAIDRDGPIAEVTVVLSALVMQNPVLRNIVDRLGSATDVDRARLIAAMTTGLNYGLRIAAAREALAK